METGPPDQMSKVTACAPVFDTLDPTFAQILNPPIYQLTARRDHSGHRTWHFPPHVIDFTDTPEVRQSSDGFLPTACQINVDLKNGGRIGVSIVHEMRSMRGPPIGFSGSFYFSAPVGQPPSFLCGWGVFAKLLPPFADLMGGATDSASPDAR